jgi:hypothetical protein
MKERKNNKFYSNIFLFLFPSFLCISSSICFGEETKKRWYCLLDDTVSDYPSSEIKLDEKMHFIYGIPVCLPICPPLSSDDLISSDEENLHDRRNFLNNQKMSTYAKQFGRHLVFSSSRKENFSDEKDIDEEFDQISLSDNYYVSL